MTSREFESIFRMLYLPLGMYALRTVGTAEAAEDIAQEVFIKAWQALEGGAEIANIKAYTGAYAMSASAICAHKKRLSTSTMCLS